MNYSFGEVKNLYDTFIITKNEKSDKFVVMRRTDKMIYEDERLLDRVKFAHTWFYATKYNQSLESPYEKLSDLTEKSYIRAFCDEYREMYETIMKVNIDYIKNNKKIIGKEELKKYVSNNVNDSDVVDGIYDTKGGLASFMKWVENSYIYEESKTKSTNMKF